MNENNAERLEKIKNEYKKDVYDCKLGRFDIRWLIDQAEYAQELEKSIKGYAFAVEVYSEMPLKDAMEKLVQFAKEEFD